MASRIALFGRSIALTAASSAAWPRPTPAQTPGPRGALSRKSGAEYACLGEAHLGKSSPGRRLRKERPYRLGRAAPNILPHHIYRKRLRPCSLRGFAVYLVQSRPSSTYTYLAVGDFSYPNDRLPALSFLWGFPSISLFLPPSPAVRYFPLAIKGARAFARPRGLRAPLLPRRPLRAVCVEPAVNTSPRANIFRIR